MNFGFARFLMASFFYVVSALLCCFGTSLPAAAEVGCPAFTRALKNGGAIIVDQGDEALYAHRADSFFVPASTLKIATVAAAMHHFGPKHRFKTEFFRGPRGELVVRGLGDPALVSEELPGIAAALSKEFQIVNGMIVDDSYFAGDIVIDGVGTSRNPYDAQNGALLVNFNTVYLRRTKAGAVVSAEEQTPLTPTAKQLGRTLRPGTKERFNLGKNKETGARYAAELLGVFLERTGVAVKGGVQLAKIPDGSNLVYTHYSSKNLEELSKDLLEYSTNFLANQLFLLLGATQLGAPATVEKGRAALSSFLREQVGWQQFSVYEGAGLSRRNQVSPRQLITLLRYFHPYKHLLPIEEHHFRAKTGSLTGVSSLAGYYAGKDKSELLFAILINDQVPRNQRFIAAQAMRRCW